MLKHSDHFHGSDLEKIEQVYNIPKENILSFSSNVNPLGISPKLKETLSQKIDAISSYPDREYTSLRKCIGKYINADYENIIVGNGSTELISLLIQIKKPKKSIIIGPTYSEYEREISLGGGSSFYYPLCEDKDFTLDIDALKDELKSDVDMLVICNPNNPTSTALTRHQMRKILDTCKQKDIFVMVDETYVEFADDIKSIDSVPLTVSYNNIIILRGISKFFAAPGLRLGYAICGNQDLIKQINQRKNPWTINILAEIAGEIMFSDTNYINETRDLIKIERNRIYNKLLEFPKLKVYKPIANFILIKLLEDNITSMDLFESAIKESMMIRDCSSFPFLDNHFIRFCFMKPEDNDRLLDIIYKTINKTKYATINSNINIFG